MKRRPARRGRRCEQRRPVAAHAGARRGGRGRRQRLARGAMAQKHRAAAPARRAARTSRPSRRTASLATTRSPSVAGLPLMVRRPARIQASASRREARPACARTFCSRSAPRGARARRRAPCAGERRASRGASPPRARAGGARHQPSRCAATGHQLRRAGARRRQLILVGALFRYARRPRQHSPRVGRRIALGAAPAAG